jgi:hypothetical protein
MSGEVVKSLGAVVGLDPFLDLYRCRICCCIRIRTRGNRRIGT